MNATTTDLPPELAASSTYLDIRELGRGGMGVVYLAKNRLMDRWEVLKVVNATFVNDPMLKKRFLREIQAAAQLLHPNIVVAYSAMEVGNSITMAMEYVPGENLSALVKRSGPMPVPWACKFAVQVAAGLQQAHERGLVHRDIKPSNLICTTQNKQTSIKIVDFGLAKLNRESVTDGHLTATGASLGTPLFMAPEQARDATTADIRADLYSLGATLYFLLSARPPINGKSYNDILIRLITEQPDAPIRTLRSDVPAELADVIDRLLHKDPAVRYATPEDARQALLPFADTGGEQTYPHTEPTLQELPQTPLYEASHEFTPTLSEVKKSTRITPAKPIREELPITLAVAKEIPVARPTGSTATFPDQQRVPIVRPVHPESGREEPPVRRHGRSWFAPVSLVMIVCSLLGSGAYYWSTLPREPGQPVAVVSKTTNVTSEQVKPDSPSETTKSTQLPIVPQAVKPTVDVKTEPPAKPMEPKPVEVKPTEPKPIDVKPTKPVEVKPTPVEVKKSPMIVPPSDPKQGLAAIVPEKPSNVDNKNPFRGGKVPEAIRPLERDYLHESFSIAVSIRPATLKKNLTALKVPIEKTFETFRSANQVDLEQLERFTVALRFSPERKSEPTVVVLGQTRGPVAETILSRLLPNSTETIMSGRSGSKGKSQLWSDQLLYGTTIGEKQVLLGPTVAMADCIREGSRNSDLAAEYLKADVNNDIVVVVTMAQLLKSLREWYPNIEKEIPEAFQQHWETVKLIETLTITIDFSSEKSLTGVLRTRKVDDAERVENTFQGFTTVLTAGWPTFRESYQKESGTTEEAKLLLTGLEAIAKNSKFRAQGTNVHWTVTRPKDLWRN